MGLRTELLLCLFTLFAFSHCVVSGGESDVAGVGNFSFLLLSAPRTPVVVWQEMHRPLDSLEAQGNYAGRGATGWDPFLTVPPFSEVAQEPKCHHWLTWKSLSCLVSSVVF